MLILLSFIATIAVGGAIGRWWTFTLPILLGAALALLFAILGYLWDSSVVIVVIVVILTELGTGLGMLLRKRFEAVRSAPV